MQLTMQTSEATARSEISKLRVRRKIATKAAMPEEMSPVTMVEMSAGFSSANP